MAAATMDYLETLHLRYLNTQAKKMIFGLGSFVKGGTTLRDSWLESHDQEVATENLGSIAEGQLNKKQQDFQETQFQLPLPPRPHDDSSFLCDARGGNLRQTKWGTRRGGMRKDNLKHA
jgi:hypothetical protein